MNIEQMKDHAREMAAVYAFLVQDLAHRKHDVDAHNLCSAVVELHGHPVQTLYAYSNLSALSKQIRERYRFIDGKVNAKLIDRGGMQDLHTEVRLINHINQAGIQAGTVISFFSARSVCPTCRSAILSAMRLWQGGGGLMAYEYKAERHGYITDLVYPILADPNAEQAAIPYS